MGSVYFILFIYLFIFFFAIADLNNFSRCNVIQQIKKRLPKTKKRIVVKRDYRHITITYCWEAAIVASNTSHYCHIQYVYHCIMQHTIQGSNGLSRTSNFYIKKPIVFCKCYSVFLVYVIPLYCVRYYSRKDNFSMALIYVLLMHKQFV